MAGSSARLKPLGLAARLPSAGPKQDTGLPDFHAAAVAGVVVVGGGGASVVAAAAVAAVVAVTVGGVAG